MSSSQHNLSGKYVKCNFLSIRFLQNYRNSTMIYYTKAVKRKKKSPLQDAVWENINSNEAITSKRKHNIQVYKYTLLRHHKKCRASAWALNGFYSKGSWIQGDIRFQLPAGDLALWLQQNHKNTDPYIWAAWSQPQSIFQRRRHKGLEERTGWQWHHLWR